MCQCQETSIERVDSPKVYLSVEYETGLLLVRVSGISDINVTTGKLYAKSVLSYAGESGEKSKNEEHTTEMVDVTANPSFEESLSVSL